MIAIGSDNRATLSGHINDTTSTYINNATVTASILDGSSVLASVNLAYVAASSGDYAGTFTAGTLAALVEGQNYTLDVIATSGSGTLQKRLSEIASYA